MEFEADEGKRAKLRELLTKRDLAPLDAARVKSETAYRDALGQLRSDLGLAPALKMIPDPTPLEGFQSIFEELQAWPRKPARTLGDLPKIVNRMPKFEDLTIDRLTLSAVYSRPDRLEEFLRAAEDIALKKTRVDEAWLNRLRQLINNLNLNVHQYILTSSELIDLVSEKDKALEFILAPPADVVEKPLGDQFANVIHLEGKISTRRLELVKIWLSTWVDRIEIKRRMGALSEDELDTFFNRFQAAPKPVEKR